MKMNVGSLTVVFATRSQKKIKFLENEERSTRLKQTLMWSFSRTIFGLMVIKCNFLFGAPPIFPPNDFE